MLDKSVPFENIVMKIDGGKIDASCEPILPHGFRFRFYEAGDEVFWAKIETAALEFESEEAGMEYFAKVFLPRAGDLKSRCIFVLSPDGEPIATTTAWFDNTPKGKREYLHWVAVSPKYQGLGLGTAVVLKALQTHARLAAVEDVYLHTQTWSHPAVRMYLKLGFVMLKKTTLKGCQNDYEKAVQVLKPLFSQELFARMIEESGE